MDEEGRTSFSFGKVMKYNHGADWEAYTEQLDYYFLANGLTDDQTKTSILLSHVSTETYQLLKDLLVPATPKDADVTYSVIVDRLQKHTKPENKHWLLDTSLTIDRDRLVNLSAITSQFWIIWQVNANSVT